MLVLPLGFTQIFEQLHTNLTGVQVDAVTIVIGIVGILMIIFGLDILKEYFYSSSGKSYSEREDEVVLDWEAKNQKRIKADKIRKREGLL